MEDDLTKQGNPKLDEQIKSQIEDDLNILMNGRQPKYSCAWKTTPFLVQMEDNLDIIVNRTHLQFFQFEDDLNILDDGLKKECKLKQSKLNQ